MCKTTSKVRRTRASFYIHSKLQKRKRKLCLFSFSYMYMYFIIFYSNYFIYKIAQKKAVRKLLYIFEKNDIRIILHTASQMHK